MKIVAAAVRVNGAIYQGKRHGECITAAVHDGAARVSQEQQGFVTDAGQFVNRIDAAAIAYRSGQIDHPKEQLYSEDVW